MSVYRIKLINASVLLVQKRVLCFWEDMNTFSVTQEKEAGEYIKACLSRDAFRPKVLSVWSEKEKPNGK